MTSPGRDLPAAPSREPVPARRYHNLDLYRGVLMVLGVWLHTAIPYFGGPFTDQTPVAADAVFKPLVFFIVFNNVIRLTPLRIHKINFK